MDSTLLKQKIKLLLSHDGVKKYGLNTIWNLFGKVTRIFFGVFVSLWVARYLGPSKFGILSYAQSFVGIFIVFANLGLDKITVRELVKGNEKKNLILGTVFWLKLFGGFIALLFLTIGVVLSTHEILTRIVVFTIGASMIFQSFDVIDYFFQYKVSTKFVAYSNIIALIASSLLKIYLIISQASLIYFGMAYLVEAMFLAIALMYFYVRNSSSMFNWKFTKAIAIRLLKDSWPMIFSGLAVSLYMKLDQLMIKELLGNEEVGYYGAAVKLSEIWLFITVAITSSLYPAIINAKKKSEELYRKRLQKMFQILVLIALSISIVISLFSTELIKLTFGNEYEPSAKILLIYVWSNIFVFLNNGSWNWYITENLQKLASIRLAIGAVVNIVLNIIFIQTYGIKGAALATILSYSVACYFGNLLSRKTWIMFKMQSLAILNIFNIKSYFN